MPKYYEYKIAGIILTKCCRKASCFHQRMGWFLSGKSSSVENKIIVIRQFLEFLKHTGESVAMPSIPSLR